MRSPWQLIMWKRKQFNKGQTHFENRLGKGKGGRDWGGGLGLEGGAGGGRRGRPLWGFEPGGGLCHLSGWLAELW